VTGILVPPRDAGELVRAILGILENRKLANRLGQAGRERVVERFSVDEMVRQTEQLYTRLLGSRRHDLES
jgi:glycosyltransferase involved in cell wall biosynthesis